LISVNTLTIGDRLGFDLRKGNGAILLRNKTVLTENMVSRLKSLGFYAVYIEDDLYEDVLVRQAIPEDMKTHILKELEDIRPKVLAGNRAAAEKVKHMGYQIYEEVQVSSIEPVNMVSTFASDSPLPLHSVNTAILTAALSIRVGIAPQPAKNYVTAALLHDLGLPDLSEDEEDGYEHTVRILKAMKESAAIDATCYMAASMHHERFDGEGGPRKLTGKQINKGARIIAVADMFDNVSFGYAGKPKLETAQTIEYIVAQSGIVLEPDLVKAFTECIAVYPTGATVILSNQVKAVVYKQNIGMPSRPVVRIVSPLAEERIEIDLLTNSAVFIDAVDF
jgi:HD-GYP domain-containing protein (c-di-GMP phosphodiesterase class II)